MLPNTTVLSTTSYPYALTMVVHVYLCVLVSVGMCISVWVYVLVGVLVLLGVSAYSTS